MDREQEFKMVDINEVEARPNPLAWLKTFVEVNYFYAFSALLMVLGCYLLMRSTLLSGGVFAKTMKSFLLLQSYELMVILTAVFIVRRFKTLNDAFILFLVELALLFDPTFFNNSFLTMMNTHQLRLQFPVVYISSATFLVTLIKLLILQRCLKLRLRWRTWVGLSYAAAVIYLAAAPLNRLESFMSQYDYYYLLGWSVVIFGLAFPTISSIRTSTNDTHGFLTPSQRKWLPRMVLFLVAFLLMAHYIESSQVYIKNYLPLYIAPPLLLLSILLAKNIPNKWRFPILFIIDFFSIMSVVYSLKGINFGSSGTIVGEVLTPPRIVVTAIPCLMAILAISGTYIYYYKKHQYEPALFRVAIIVAGIAIYAIFRSQVIPKGTDILGRGLIDLMSILRHHPNIVIIPLWAVILYVAWKVPSFASWAAAGFYTLTMVFHLTPLRLVHWFPEAIQAFFLWELVLYYKFGDPKRESIVAATLIAIVACLRFLVGPEFWTAGVVIAEVVLFAVIGFYDRRSWFILAAIQAGCLTLYYSRFAIKAIHPVAWVIAAGLILFTVGLFVTFSKNRILAWLERDRRVYRP